MRIRSKKIQLLIDFSIDCLEEDEQVLEETYANVVEEHDG
jgi:hypothetical protein